MPEIDAHLCSIPADDCVERREEDVEWKRKRK